MQGYVALHRKLMESWVGEDPMALALWVRMLLEATHKPRRKAHKGTFYNLEKGQFLFGLGRWSEKTGIPREVIRKRMDLFQSDGMITRQKHPHTSIVTLVNWDSYQQDNTLTTQKEHPNNTQTTRKQQEYNNVNNGDNGNKENITEDSQANADKFAEQIKEVFQHWKSTMGKDGKSKLTKKRESRVRARLSDGFSVAELCKAIDGCKASPYHQGGNPAGTVYDDLELICRDDGKVNMFSSLKDKHGKPQSRTVDPCAGQKFESRINPELLKPREQHNEQGN